MRSRMLSAVRGRRGPVFLLAALAGVGPALAEESAVAPTSYVADEGEQAAMIRQLARRRGGQTAALAQVIQLSRSFDDATAAEILDELAAAHARAGAVNLAAETRAFLAERYADEPRSADAVRWLVRLYASSEAAHARRSESAGAAALRRQLAPAIAKGLERTTAPPPRSSKLPPPQDQHAVYALHLATQAIGRQPALAEDAALQFQRAVAARRAGEEKTAQSLLASLEHRGKGDAWGQCARVEPWLVESPRGMPPKRVAACQAAAARPHLDGVLDDACWQVPPGEGGASTTTGGDEPDVQVRWAHDADHLYVALACPKAAGADYARDDRPRPRDGDVAAHDHVRLLIDVDRDYASWFELAVDCRGWTRDDCWGDASWNPTWYVARGETADGAAWTIEAAIPLAELSAAAPGAGGAWACAVERRTPGGASSSEANGGAAWPGPADFSVLLFE